MVTSCSRDRASATTPRYMWLPPTTLPQLYSKTPIFMLIFSIDRSRRAEARSGTASLLRSVDADREPGGPRGSAPRAPDHAGPVSGSMLNHRPDLTNPSG